MSGHVLLENVPRATGQGLIFSECSKYGNVRSIDFDPNNADMFGGCQALVTYDTNESAQNAVKRFAKRINLFGSDMPIDVRIMTDEEVAERKQEAEPELPDTTTAIGEDLVSPAAASTEVRAADPRRVAETGLQIRERVRDRHREAQPQEGRADDADRYHRQDRRVRERVREPREERARFENHRDADVGDRYHRQDQRVPRRRFAERDDSRGRPQQDDRRPQQDERRRRVPPRDHRSRSPRDDVDGYGAADLDYDPEAEPPRRRRKRRIQSLRPGEESDDSSGDDSPEREAQPPAEIKKRAMSGFDKKEPAAGAQPTLPGVPGASTAVMVAPQVTTRGNWAEIQGTGSTPYYGNIMTGAKQLSMPAEFGRPAPTPGGVGPNGVLNIKGTTMNSNVYVGLMPIGITEPEFRQLFAPYGSIMSTRLMGTRNGGVCGFVKYTSYMEAQMAINNMNGLAIAGTKLKVKLADQDNLGFNPAILRLQQTTGLPTASI